MSTIIKFARLLGTFVLAVFFGVWLMQLLGQALGVLPFFPIPLWRNGLGFIAALIVVIVIRWSVRWCMRQGGGAK